jgi:hypothetical protein
VNAVMNLWVLAPGSYLFLMRSDEGAPQLGGPHPCACLLWLMGNTALPPPITRCDFSGSHTFLYYHNLNEMLSPSKQYKWRSRIELRDYFLWRVLQNVNFKFKPPAIFPFFVFRKSGLIKSCSSPEDLSEYKMSWSYVEWCKFYIHLKSLNVRHFGMVAATTLQIMASRSPSMA